MDFFKKYWTVITILLLVISLTFTWNLYNNTKQENIKIKNENSVAKQIEQVEVKDKEVKNREQNVYPVIDKRITEIKETQLEIRRKVEDEVKKDDVNTIARKFTQLGYSSCVVRR